MYAHVHAYWPNADCKTSYTLVGLVIDNPIEPSPYTQKTRKEQLWVVGLFFLFLFFSFFPLRDCLGKDLKTNTKDPQKKKKKNIWRKKWSQKGQSTSNTYQPNIQIFKVLFNLNGNQIIAYFTLLFQNIYLYFQFVNSTIDNFCWN